MRLAWNRWIPPFRRHKAEELNALRLAVKPERKRQEEQEDDVWPKRPFAGPFDHLQRAAELSLSRTSKETLAALNERARARDDEELFKILPKAAKGLVLADTRVGAAELLLYLRTLPTAEMETSLRFDNDQMRLAYKALLQQPVQPVTIPEQVAEKRVPPVAASVPPLAPPTVDVPVQPKAAAQIRQKANQIPLQIPTPGPSWLRKLFQKKGSPKGGKNGKG